MKTGNSYSHIKTFDDSEFLIKIFDKSRTYYFYHEYFISQYLKNLGNDFVSDIYKIDKKNLEIYFVYYPQNIRITKEYARKYFELIKSIHNYSNKQKCNLYAKESFKSVNQLIDDIENRIGFLLQNQYQSKINLKDHLLGIINLLDKCKKYVVTQKIYSLELFNHADSGLHNCILNNNGSLLLSDLEYAGLDSPIKQCIDYLLHPKNNNNLDINQIWLDYFINECIDKRDREYLNIYFSLFGLKWSLILLNEFQPDIWKIRIHADPSRVKKHDIIMQSQLIKSKIYFKAINKILDNENPAKLFTNSERLFLSKPY